MGPTFRAVSLPLEVRRDGELSMIQYVTQSTFSRCPYGDDVSMNVHVNGDRTARTLLLFVHGLGGDGYRSWAEFPAMAFNDRLLDMDVGLFNYASGLKRYSLRWQTSEIDNAIEELSKDIALLPHSLIVLVCHSLGATVGLTAVKRYREQYLDRPKIIEKTAGAILMASVRAGSPWAYIPLPIMRKDRRALRPNSSESQVVDEFISNLEYRLKPTPYNCRMFFPIFAAHATNDWLVGRGSTSVSIPTEQRQLIRGGHGAIIKLNKRRIATFEWLKDCLTKIRSRRALWNQFENRPIEGQIVAHFNGRNGQGDWDEAYLQAVRLTREQGHEVLDVSQTAPSTPVSVRIRVIRANEIQKESVIFELGRDGEFQRQQGKPIGVSPFGAGSRDALDRIELALGDKPDGAFRWVERTFTNTALRDEIVKWLKRVAQLQPRPHENFYRDDLRDEAVLSSELPHTAAEVNLYRPTQWGA